MGTDVNVREQLKRSMQNAKPTNDDGSYLQVGAIYVLEVAKLRTYTGRDGTNWFLGTFKVLECSPTITREAQNALASNRQLNAVGTSAKWMVDTGEDWAAGVIYGFMTNLLGLEDPKELFEEENNTTPYDYILEDDGKNARGLRVICEAYYAANGTPRFNWKYLPAPKGHALAAK